MDSIINARIETAIKIKQEAPERDVHSVVAG